MEKSFLALFVLTASCIQDAACYTYFKTYVGCNATFVCYSSPGRSVNWTNSLGSLSQGEKLKISNEPFYSVLTMTGLTTADQGNISCIRNQKDPLYFTLEVQSVQTCADKSNTDTCKATVDSGDNCTEKWMKEWCMKSCGLCPKISCTEEQQATVPPTSALTTTIPVESTTRNSSSTDTPEANGPENSSSVCSSRYYHYLIIQFFLLWIAIL